MSGVGMARMLRDVLRLRSVCVIAACVGCLWSAPAASGEAVGILDAPDAEAIAVAGGEVVVARRDENGGVRLDAVPRSGGAPRGLLAVPSSSLLSARDPLVASPSLVALLLGRVNVHGETIGSELYAGPPSGPLQRVWVQSARRARQSSMTLVEFDGPEAMLLVSGINGRTRGWWFDSTGLRARAPWVTSRFVPTAVTARDAAVVAGRPRRVAIVDRRDGHVRISRRVGARAGTGADLAPDGRLLTTVRAGLLTLRPGESPRTIPRTAGLVTPVFAGASIAAVHQTRDDSRPVLIGPDDTPRVMGGPTGSLGDISADADGVAWLANGCVRYAPISGPAPIPAADRPCPQTEIGLYAIDKSWVRDDQIRVRVHCIATPTDACRGTLLLKDFEDQSVVASGPFTVPAGARRRVPVTLSEEAIAIARRRYGFNIDAAIPDGRVGPGCCGASEITVKVPR